MKHCTMFQVTQLCECGTTPNHATNNPSARAVCHNNSDAIWNQMHAIKERPVGVGRRKRGVRGLTNLQWIKQNQICTEARAPKHSQVQASASTLLTIFSRPLNPKSRDQAILGRILRQKNSSSPVRLNKNCLQFSRQARPSSCANQCTYGACSGKGKADGNEGSAAEAPNKALRRAPFLLSKFYVAAGGDDASDAGGFLGVVWDTYALNLNFFRSGMLYTGIFSSINT
eukprot:TRINITY_DN6652_c0_g1_i1.p1 TRINITY_DN6652_c0_g1~~TRINITY_DN6652_c0_g1_i1.p1  ORF type:complete len:228 (+),score=22.03 TRINITY_DN6652_c0_g1_i1:133-816(+)